MTQYTSQQLPGWSRIFMMIVAIILLMGAGLLILPELMLPFWFWELKPFNARFLGGFYLSELVVVLILIRFHRWSPGRVIYPLAFLFTTLVSVVSIFYMDKFKPTSGYIEAWLIVFIGSALVTGSVWQNMKKPEGVVEKPTSGRIQLALSVQAYVLGGYGVSLLLFPVVSSAFWPWTLDAFHGRMYASVFLLFALGSFLLRKTIYRMELLAQGSAQIVWGLCAITGLLLVDSQTHLVTWTTSGVWIWVVGFSIICMTGILLIHEGFSRNWDILSDD